jgi:hypothetical protein
MALESLDMNWLVVGNDYFLILMKNGHGIEIFERKLHAV